MVLNIKKINIQDIALSSYNPRKIRDEEYNSLKNSINEFGVVDPIIVNLKNNNIVGGHQRYNVLYSENNNQTLYLLELGDVGWVFPEIDLKIKDENYEKALNLALNRIKGEFDVPKLNPILEELADVNLDYLTGFDIELEDIGYELLERDSDDDEEFYEIEEQPYEPIYEEYYDSSSNTHYEDSGEEDSFIEEDSFEEEDEETEHFTSKGDIYRIYNNIVVYADDEDEYKSVLTNYPHTDFLEFSNLNNTEIIKVPIYYYVIYSQDLLEQLIRKHINFTEKLN